MSNKRYQNSFSDGLSMDQNRYIADNKSYCYAMNGSLLEDGNNMIFQNMTGNELKAMLPDGYVVKAVSVFNGIAYIVSQKYEIIDNEEGVDTLGCYEYTELGTYPSPKWGEILPYKEDIGDIAMSDRTLNLSVDTEYISDDIMNNISVLGINEYVYAIKIANNGSRTMSRMIYDNFPYQVKNMINAHANCGITSNTDVEVANVTRRGACAIGFVDWEGFADSAGEGSASDADLENIDITIHYIDRSNGSKNEKSGLKVKYYNLSFDDMIGDNSEIEGEWYGPGATNNSPRRLYIDPEKFSYGAKGSWNDRGGFYDIMLSGNHDITFSFKFNNEFITPPKGMYMT